jgi:molybdopterin-guanine dinucleotide biosynthesis protein A
MPSADPFLLLRLADLMRDDGRAAAMPLVDGIAQPLHAVIDVAALPVIVALAVGGERSPRRLLARMDALLVGPDGWGPFDPVAAFATDWDRPSDLPSASRT